MYYTVYKITNTLNGKYYIGKHKTTDINDGYMGSGRLISRAIRKHGIENFKKEILFVFDNEQEMNEKEKELVVVSEETYNLCSGGHGGFGYINTNRLNLGEAQSEAARRQGRINLAKINSDPEQLEKKKENLKKATKIRQEKLPGGTWVGKKHSPETIEKIRQAAKNRVPWNKGKAWKDWHPGK